MVTTDTAQPPPQRGGGLTGLKRTIWPGLLAEVGVVAFIDETFSHQPLIQPADVEPVLPVFDGTAEVTMTSGAETR